MNATFGSLGVFFTTTTQASDLELCCEKSVGDMAKRGPRNLWKQIIFFSYISLKISISDLRENKWFDFFFFFQFHHIWNSWRQNKSDFVDKKVKLHFAK